LDGLVLGVAVSADGRRAVSASDDGTLKVWDVGSGRELRTLQGHADWAIRVAVSADGRRVISASGDTLTVWDVEAGKLIATFTCDAEVCCCAFVADDQFIAGDRGGYLHSLRLEEPQRKN
jgi:WD40 repeat protein